jgi:hypothetical protein
VAKKKAISGNQINERKKIIIALIAATRRRHKPAWRQRVAYGIAHRVMAGGGMKISENRRHRKSAAKIGGGGEKTKSAQNNGAKRKWRRISSENIA